MRDCFDQEIPLLIGDTEKKKSQHSLFLEVWDNSVIEFQLYWSHDFKNSQHSTIQVFLASAWFRTQQKCVVGQHKGVCTEACKTGAVLLFYFLMHTKPTLPQSYTS